MSDRREDVARAFWEARESYISEARANAVCRGTDGDSYPDCVERIYELASLAGADAALAAMDAEPTEAEIDAAMEAGAAVWSAAWANGWGCTIDAADWKPEQRNAMRAALLAARNARHE